MKTIMVALIIATITGVIFLGSDSNKGAFDNYTNIIQHHRIQLDNIK